jgi:hypothetical protein
MQATAVRVAEAERDAAARAVTVQQRLANPNVTVQLGVRQLRVASGPAVVAGISVPLPFFDRNRGNISAARAELQGPRRAPPRPGSKPRPGHALASPWSRRPTPAPLPRSGPWRPPRKATVSPASPTRWAKAR